MIELILRFFNSFFDFEKVHSGYAMYMDYYEFNKLVRYHVVKSSVLAAILLLFIVVLILSGRKKKA